MIIISTTGQIVNDPRIGKAQKGYSYANFQIACNSHSDKDESIIDVTCFGKTADIVREYCTKGMYVLVCGEGEIGAKDINGSSTGRLKITAKIVDPEEASHDCESERSTVNNPKQQSVDLDDDDPWS